MRDARRVLRRAFADAVAGADGDLPRLPAARRPSPALAAALRRHAARVRRGKVQLPPGDEIDNDFGRCYVRRIEYPLDTRHGREPLAAARAVSWARIAELAKAKALDLGLEDCLFLDTETTGLSGGAGTVVFLTGLGFFEADRFVLEQVFLRSFADEPAALAHVGARLAQRPWLVTFVGKSFDRHRLASRMTLHRVPAPVLTDKHLDLYYLARRAWGKELPDVRLRTVEERRLGVLRDDDLPGSQAPWAFLQWLRDATGPVDRVLEHNRIDVLSLVSLLVALGESRQ